MLIHGPANNRALTQIKMEDLKVGDKLFVHIKGRITIESLKEVIITKVGRVYYELDDWRYKRVRKNDLRYEDPSYSQNNFQAFRSEEDYNRAIEISNKRAAITKFFAYTNKLSYDDIDAVHAIISKYG